jgi:hypothetical protein
VNFADASVDWQAPLHCSRFVWTHTIFELRCLYGLIVSSKHCTTELDVIVGSLPPLSRPKWLLTQAGIQLKIPNLFP